MRIVLTHPTGNRNVRAVLQGFIDENLLAEFGTTVASNPDSLWIKILPLSIQRELLRRTFLINSKHVWTHKWLELLRMGLPKIGLDRYVTDERSFASIDSVYKNFDRAMARRLITLSQKGKLDAVYAYEDGALETFKQAKELGVKCVYDLPIAYWETGRKLMMEDAERLPNWAKTLGGGISDSPEKLARKTQELELADVIVCPGEFVMNSVPAWAKAKKKIVSPFGSPIVDQNQPEVKKDIVRPLRVLFAGSMGQRKGLGDLFNAVKFLNRSDIELVVMGSLLEPMEFYRNEFPHFIYEPGRPHHEVLQLMKSCDVFCLPSIVEGRALVMQEAMSQGLPVIITANTGGQDLIIEGKTGFLVPIRSPEAIAEKLNWFLENRCEIVGMGEMARQHAATYTWQYYGSTITKLLKEYLS